MRGRWTVCWPARTSLSTSARCWCRPSPGTRPLTRRLWLGLPVPGWRAALGWCQGKVSTNRIKERYWVKLYPLDIFRRCQIPSLCGGESWGVAQERSGHHHQIHKAGGGGGIPQAESSHGETCSLIFSDLHKMPWISVKKHIPVHNLFITCSLGKRRWGCCIQVFVSKMSLYPSLREWYWIKVYLLDLNSAVLCSVFFLQKSLYLLPIKATKEYLRKERKHKRRTK